VEWGASSRSTMKAFICGKSGHIVMAWEASTPCLGHGRGRSGPDVGGRLRSIAGAPWRLRATAWSGA
jgi:hypothetical protein